MSNTRTPLLVAPELQGRAFAEAHADTTDQWFQELAADPRVKMYTAPAPSRLRGAPITSVLPSVTIARPKSSIRDE